MRTSGFHNLCGGMRRSLTPPNSDAFHLRFMSFHSWNGHRESLILKPIGHLSTDVRARPAPAFTDCQIIRNRSTYRHWHFHSKLTHERRIVRATKDPPLQILITPPDSYLHKTRHNSPITLKTHQFQPDVGHQQLVLFVLEKESFELCKRTIITPTTSMICINVKPKLSCKGSDSLATGRSSTL